MQQPYKIIRYPDGGAYVKLIRPIYELIYRINSYEDLFLLESIIDANTIPASLMTLIIPCMFQQQHDRRFKERESFELRLVCNFINSLGLKEVRVYHPHSDVTPALLNNCTVISNDYLVQCAIGDIMELHEGKDLILMSTDAGGFKPLMKLVDEIDWKGDTFSASKARKFENNKSVLIQTIGEHDFKGSDILIVDDICVYGGTFIGLAELLKERNVGNLYLAVSHITIPNPNPKLEELFKMIYTTDSKGLEYQLDNIKTFKLFDYAY